MTVYAFEAQTMEGEMQSLEAYKGNVLLIVNTASQCGLTPQYAELQSLYERYREQGFAVLGFPCNQFGGQEPGTNEEVRTFCETQYQVTFPLFAKIDVRGEEKHPLFAYLVKEAPFRGFDENDPRAKRMEEFLSAKLPEYLAGDDIKWNFTKFLIDREGNVVARFEPPVPPSRIEDDIRAQLER